MKFKISIFTALLFCLLQTKAQQISQKSDSISHDIIHIIKTDSLLENLSTNSTFKSSKTDSQTPHSKYSKLKKLKISESIVEKNAFDSLIIVKKIESENIESPFLIPENLPTVHIDTLVLNSNPFFIDLVYENIPLNFNWNLEPDFRKLYYGKKATTLVENAYEQTKVETPEQSLIELRNDERKRITKEAANLYAFTYDQLPDPGINKNRFIKEKPLKHVQFVDEDEVFYNSAKKLRLQKIIISPWSKKASALAQFSEYTVSTNWYQGGNNYLAVLGILAGELNYDNNDDIEWDNNGEWHIGFNTVSGDTLRMLSTNDDVMKINSKLGIKAGGNWFYSGSVDFSTQFFNNYKGINSTSLKASFLTPVRLNVGVGFDYKYKKLFSLMLSPVAFKYIYLDNRFIDPNLFGINKGMNTLSEIGSSFKAIVSYAPTRDIQLDSKLSFYTNYQKVEIDWEMVCNFTINRFMSTRISFNPRYDNTVIMAPGELPKIQFKQLLSVGFSHKFR